MAKKSKFIKNLLTTASAVAVLAGGASNALGAEVNTDAAVVNFNTGAGLVGGAPLADSVKVHNNGVAITTGGRDSAAIDVNGKTGVTLTVDANTTLGSIGNGTRTTAQGPDGNKTITTTVNQNATLTLDGKNTNSTAPVPANTYVGLGNVVLGTGAGANDATLLIALNGGGATTLFGDITSNVNGNNSNIQIDANNNITFTGLIGTAGEAVTTLKLNGAAAKAHLNAAGAAANAVKNHHIGTVDFRDATAELRIANYNKVNGAAAASADGNGVLIFSANGELTGNAGATLGTRLKQVQVDGAGLAVIGGQMHTESLVLGKDGSTLEVRGAAKFDDGAGRVYKFTQDATLIAKEGWDGGIDFDDKNATFTVGGGNVTGAIDNAAGAGGKGTVNVVGNADVTFAGALGATNSLNAVNLEFDAADKKAIFSNNATANTFTFVKDGIVELTAGKTLEGTSLVNGVQANGAQVDNQGGIIVNGAGGAGTATAKIKLGAADARLKSLNFARGVNDTLEVQSEGLWVQDITGAAAQGILTVSGKEAAPGTTDPAQFVLDVVTSNTNNDGLHELNIDQTAVNGGGNVATHVTLRGKVTADSINLLVGQDHNLILDTNSTLIGDTIFKANNQALVLREGATYQGEIVADANNRGNVIVEGNSAMTGDNIGVGGGFALQTIQFAKDGNKVLTRGNATAAVATQTTVKTLDFQTNGTLRFVGNESHTLTSAVQVNAGTDAGRGTIHFAGAIQDTKALAINGAIGNTGDNQQRLELLYNESAAPLTLAGGDVHVNTYQFGADSVLQLNENLATYRFDHFDSGENAALGKLHFNDDLTIRTASYGDETPEFKKTLLSEMSFLGNRNVTVAEGSLLRANVLKTGGNNGTIIFAGNAVFDAAIETGGNTLRGIQVNGVDGTTVDYRQNVSLNDGAAGGDLSFANGGTFMFSGQNLTAHEINKAGAAVANGKLKLARVGNQQDINAAITADVDVEFAGGNVALVGNQSASTRYTFSSAEAMSANLLNSDISAAQFTVGANVDAVHTVKFDQDGLVFNSASLGDDKALIFEAGNTVTNISVATAGKSQSAQFTSTRKDTAVLEFARPANQSSTISSVGTESNPFAVIRANAADGVIEGAAWTNLAEIADNKTLTFNGAVGVGTNGDQEIRLQGENAKVVFGGEGLVLRHELVNTSDTNRGFAAFGDRNVTVEGLIGTANKRLREVSFTFAEGSEKAATLNNDIHAQDVKFTRGAYNVGNANNTGGIKLNGNFTANAAKLNLGTNSLQSSGGNAVFDGANMLNTSYNGTVGGSFTNADNDLRVNDGASLAVVVNDVTVGIPREDASFTVLKNNGNALGDAAKAAIASAAGNLSATGNASAKWVAEVDASGNLVLKRTNNAQVRLAEIAAEQGVTDVNSRGVLNLLVAAPAGTSAGKTADELNDLATSDKAKFAEAVQRLSTNVENAINDMAEHAASLVSSRVVSGSLPLVSGPDLQVESVASEGLGVAAGDDHDRYGIWATPFFSNANQKARKGAPGYKGDSYGLTAGFDTKVNDDMVIGLATTYASSDVKHKDSKRGDKTKIESYMFSVYGSQQLTTNWFLSGIATVASNQVKNSSLRVTPTGNQVARGKYSSMSFSGELLAGYNYAMNGFAVTPMAGFRYSRVNDGGYKESGTTNQNLDISKKASDKFDAIAGLRLSGSAYDMQGLSVTPEAHVFVHHDLINKNPNVSVKIDGVSGNLPQTSAKSARTFYNAGLGATAKYGMMEYGATYDANFGNKLVSHQGTLKVRVNF